MAFKDLRDMVFTESLPGTNVSSRWQENASKDPFLNGVIMTIDLVFANGFRIGVATENLEVLDAAGNSHIYLPMLQAEPEINSTYNLMSGGASQRSLTLTIDSRRIKPLDIMKEIGAISGFAEICLQKKGMLYEQRYKLIIGDMVGGLSFGANEEPMSIQISDPKLTNDQIIPSQICSKDRIPTAQDSAMGNRYPLILNDFPYVPTLMITYYAYGPRFLVASGNVEVTGVYVGNEDAAGKKFGPTDTINGSPGYVVETVKDDLGDTFTQINFNFTSTGWASNESCFAEVKSLDNTGETHIISLMENLISNHSYLGSRFLDENLFNLSYAKISKAEAKLCINGSGETTTATLTSYIESTICNSFPMISMAYTGFGYGPVVTDRRSDTIVYSLVRGQNIIMDRASALQEVSREDIYNSFTFRYNYSPIDNDYQKSVIINWENSSICAKSRDMLGPRELAPIESPIIFDEFTANYIVQWLENHIALPSYTVEYFAVPAAYFILNLGDNVYLTDDKLGISESVATVISLDYKRGQCTIGLKLWYGYTGAV